MWRLIQKIKARVHHTIRPVLETARRVSKSKIDFVFIFFDIIYCRFRFHFNCDEYLKYSLYNLKNRYRKNYITCYHQRHDYSKINTKDFTRSKFAFYQRMPDLFQRDMILIPSCGAEAFLSFAKKHQEFIIKPDKGSWGRGIQKFKYVNDEQTLNFFMRATEGTLVCEEYIHQHSALETLNPFCVNTLRIVSLLLEDDVEILSAVLKVGGNPNVIVDNMHQGGIGAQVDVVHGLTTTYGYDYKFNVFTHHPLTGVQIIGFQVPNWEHVIALIKRGHKRISQCKLLGWDVAITQDGVELVEVNNAPGPLLMQTMDGVPKGEKLLQIFKEGNSYKEEIL